MIKPDLANELESALYEEEMDLDCLKAKLHATDRILSLYNQEDIQEHFDDVIRDIKSKLIRAMHANPNSKALPNIYQYFYELNSERLYESVLIIRQKLGQFIISREQESLSQSLLSSENDTKPEESDEYIEIDEFKNLLDDLGNFLQGNELQYVARCMSAGQLPLLTAFGLRLQEEKQTEFFEAMARFYPLDTYFTVLLGKTASKTYNQPKVKYAIDRLLIIGREQKILPTAGALARRIQDHNRMIAVMNALEPWLNEARCLNEYTFLAVETKQRSAVEKAIAMLEEHPVDEGALKCYSKAACFLRDNKRMSGIIRVIEDHLNVIPLLKEYVILAIALRDVKALQISSAVLENHLETKWFLMRYSHIARILNDFEAMVKAQILLRRRLNDPACRKSHDILEDRIKMEIQRREHNRKKCGTG